MLGCDLEESVVSRMVRGAVEGDDRRPVGETGDHHPWTHDPAHVRGPHEAIAGMNVGLECSLLSQFHGQATMSVDCSLGSSGRSRRVCEQNRVLGVGGYGRKRFRSFDHVVPPVVTTILGRRVRPPGHSSPDHRRDPADKIDRPVRRLFHLDESSVPSIAVGADECGGAGLIDPGCHGVHAETGEDRDEHCADAGSGEQCDHRLG